MSGWGDSAAGLGHRFAAAWVRVRAAFGDGYHHRGPFCEGRGLTHALTDTAPTDLTVATHSPLGAQPQYDRILRLPCARFAPAASYTLALDALKRACRSSSLQASISARSALSGCRRRWRGSTLPAAALVPMVETDECGDVWTRGGPHCDGACLCRA